MSKSLLAVAIAVLITLVVATFAGAQGPYSQDSNKTSTTTGKVERSLDVLDLIKTVAQIGFCVIIATVAVLTFNQARKTILQPIRTEVFKAQLQEMTKILTLFVGKGETDLRHDFAFDKAVFANTCRMFDSYRFTFFDQRAELDTRPYNRTECPSSIVTEKHLRPADDHLKIEKGDRNSEETRRDPRVRAALWADYDHGELHVPRKYSTTDDKLQQFLENPLLPTECVRLLGEYKELAKKNLFRIRDVMTECAKEMPDKYPNIDQLNKASGDWIRHRYVKEFEHMKEKADAIVSFVRQHYSVDTIMQS